jgi:hypothetical protein
VGDGGGGGMMVGSCGSGVVVVLSVDVWPAVTFVGTTAVAFLRVPPALPFFAVPLLSLSSASLFVGSSSLTWHAWMDR